jgi:cold shock CspA family protein
MTDTESSGKQATRKIGRVKWFNNQKGYGFLTYMNSSSEWEDVFVHHSELPKRNSHFRYLVQDEYVEFALTASNAALSTAVDVTGPCGMELAYELRNKRRAEEESSETNESRPRYRGGGPRTNKVQVGSAEWKLVKGGKNVEMSKASSEDSIVL